MISISQSHIWQRIFLYKSTFLRNEIIFFRWWKDTNYMYFCVFCRFLWNPYTWVSPPAMLSWPPEMLSLYGIFEQPKVGQHSNSMTNPHKTTNHRKNSTMSMTRPRGACTQLQGAGAGRPNRRAARAPVNFRSPMTQFVVLRLRKKFCWSLGKVDLYRDMRCLMWLWRIDIISVLKLINWLWIVIARKWFHSYFFQHSNLSYKIGVFKWISRVIGVSN